MFIVVAISITVVALVIVAGTRFGAGMRLWVFRFLRWLYKVSS
jgi:hypothetical protein